MENGAPKSYESIFEYLAKIGQQHLLNYWSQLNEQEQSALLSQIDQLMPLEKLCHDFQKTAGIMAATDVKEMRQKMHCIEPQHYSSFVSTNKNDLDAYWKAGLSAIANGEVAVILLAGGQGTRLGVPYPKGMYDVGLASKKTLFELQAERILQLQQIANEFCAGKNGKITWYIMTSEATQEQSENFFEEKNFFGLEKSQVVFFEQGVIPCFTFDGKIILEAKNRVAVAPDGNGGLYKALVKYGTLTDMQNRRLKYLHIYCVDNVLARVADPIFIGYCITKKSDCAAKVVEKKVPDEPVGVVCKVDGVGVCVVEYSEIPKELAEELGLDGKLLYRAGNIANHFFTVPFLQKICASHLEQLEYHVAKKKIPYIDDHGILIKPKQPNGIKLEKFVFDVFKFSENFYIWEVAREEEFSPLKNLQGVDSPATCCDDFLRLERKWRDASDAKSSDLPDCEMKMLDVYFKHLTL